MVRTFKLGTSMPCGPRGRVRDGELPFIRWSEREKDKVPRTFTTQQRVAQRERLGALDDHGIAGKKC